MPNATEHVTIEVLQKFAEAWNRHDVDALMSFMTEDCVFEASAGPDVCGARFVGRDAVRAAFAEVWAAFPDAHWGEAVKALVVLRPGMNGDAALVMELIESVKRAKGSVQAPKSVDFVPTIPLTPVGKPDKKALRAQYWAGVHRKV